MRFLLGGLTLLVWALATRRAIVPGRNEVLPLAALCALFVGTIGSTNLGQDRTSASHAVVILTAFPIWTAVLSHLFIRGDRMGPPQVLGVVLSYAGVVVTFAPSFGEGTSAVQGDLLIMLASVLLGGSQVLIAVLAQRIELAKIVLSQAFSAVVVLFIASAAIEGTDYDFAGPLIVSLLYQGVLVGGLGFVANGWLLKTYLPSRVSVIYSTQPFFGIIASYFVLGEPIGIEVVAGVILVTSGILAVQEVWRVIGRPRTRPA
jgi:drug/metabolite transporter (DMT)-like permease